MGLLWKFDNCLPRSSLTTIFISLARPHLDYDDVIFDKANNDSFHRGLESLQYKASLAITGATKGSPTENLYQELRLESLQNKRWFRKLCIFYNVFMEQPPKCLFDLIPSNSNSYQTRN